MIAAGSDLVQTQSSQCSSAMRIIDDRENFRNIIGLLPWLDPVAHFVPDPVFQRGLRGAEAVVDFARACVARRISAPGLAREDILGKLIETYTADAKFAGKDEEGKETEVVETLVRDTITLLIAGADSVSCSMGAVLFYVLSTPRTHARLLAELSAACPGGDADVSWEKVKGLPYFQACIDEGCVHYPVHWLQRSLTHRPAA